MKYILRKLWTLCFKLFGIDISSPLRYSDFSYCLLEFKADYHMINGLFSSGDIIPIEYAPGETKIQFVSLSIKKASTPGSWNELSVQVPIKPLDGLSTELYGHLYLPLDQEFSKWFGGNIYGFPTSLAQININEQAECIENSVVQDLKKVLQFTAQKSPGKLQSKELAFIGKRKAQLIKTELFAKGFIFESTDIAGCQFELGKHSVSYALRNIMLDNTPIRVEMGYMMKGQLSRPVKIPLVPSSSSAL